MKTKNPYRVGAIHFPGDNRLGKWCQIAGYLALPAILAGVAGLDVGAPRWAVMWSVALAMYIVFKGLAYLMAGRDPAREAKPGALWSWFIFWPGMDPGPFLETPHPRDTATSAGEWTRAFAIVCMGVFILYAGARQVPQENIVAIGWIGMAGFLLILHFGVFKVLALYWRSRGIPVDPIMNSPYRAESVAEFWGKRWNRAFRDLAWSTLVRPLRGIIGATGSLLVVFAVSGLIHELVVSYPARGGYGGPSVYFLIQGFGSMIQRTRTLKALGMHKGFKGWIFTMICVLAPAFWLFHPTFMKSVFVPFMRAIGAL